MNKEINELSSQIEKSINEIAKDFEMQYRDFLPSFIGLSNCKDKIQKAINNGNEQLKKIKEQLADVEEFCGKAKEDSPHAKQQIMQEFINRLGLLNEMEVCLNALWLLPTDKKAFDPASNVRVITRLEGLYEKLESNTENNIEAVNERILPLISNELQAKKSELCQTLDDFFNTFLHFKTNDRVVPKTVQMCVEYPNVKFATDHLSAMQRLGIFESYLESFVDTVWEQFCMKLIYADGNPEELIKISYEKFNGNKTTFVIDAEVPTTKKPKPAQVFRALTKFFDGVQQALQEVRVCEHTFIDIFGESIAEQLISALERGCLNPAIPYKKDQAAIVHAELTALTTDFLQSMKELGFFLQPVSDLFVNFFDNFERISIDRRCHHYITTSRDLVKIPYVEVMEVGSSSNEAEEKAADIMKNINEQAQAGKEGPKMESTAQWDKYYSKIFQFQRSKISVSTFKLVNLLQEILQTANETNSELETCRLVTTAENILDMFINLSPDCHKNALTSVPQIAAIFFNNCHYICHRLMTLATEVMKKVKTTEIAQENSSFAGLFNRLRKLGADTVEMHVVNARRQLSATIGDRDIFTDLSDAKAHQRCKKALQACTLQIEQTANVWAEVMSSYILAQTVGFLVSHLLGLMVDIILKKEDIASSDAEHMATQLDHMVERLKEIMTIDGKPMIQKLCEQPYFQLTEIIFCLRGNLAEIGHRWCEGKGPLAAWLKASQVKQLVRALFQNTEKRAELLALMDVNCEERWNQFIH